MVGGLSQVIGGVDTHADTHTVAAIDGLGRLLGHQQFPTTRRGYKAALSWLQEQGEVVSVGVEGTGAYGAGLARYLSEQSVPVIEVDRPNRQQRRKNGKSDPADAEAAARAVLAGTATGTPKSRDGVVEALRALRVTKRSADKAHTAARNSLRHMVITAPAGLREQLEPLQGDTLVQACARLRPDHSRLNDPATAIKTSLRRLARRVQHLAAELDETKADIDALVRHAAPRLLEQFGVGPDTASQLLVTAGDNPERLHNERSFAALCGVSPVSASSGRTDRHRLNRGGDRYANEALWRIVLVRMSHDKTTKEYVVKRTAQGLTKPEIMRCLKRYVARELFTAITASLTPDHALPTTTTQAPTAA